MTIIQALLPEDAPAGAATGNEAFADLSVRRRPVLARRVAWHGAAPCRVRGGAEGTDAGAKPRS